LGHRSKSGGRAPADGKATGAEGKATGAEGTTMRDGKTMGVEDWHAVSLAPGTLGLCS